MAILTPDERPRLYLDIDGVIIAKNSPFATVDLNPIEKYAPEVIIRLGNIGMNLVWLSTWEEKETSHLSKQLELLINHHRLDSVPSQAELSGITRKMLALINDNQGKLTPIVWVDDEITPEVIHQVSEKHQGPKLLISPNKQIGLSEIELNRIEDFAKEYIVRRSIDIVRHGNLLISDMLNSK